MLPRLAGVAGGGGLDVAAVEGDRAFGRGDADIARSAGRDLRVGGGAAENDVARPRGADGERIGPAARDPDVAAARRVDLSRAVHRADRHVARPLEADGK